MKILTQDQIDLIKKPLPPEAIKPHPTKTYLSSIKAIYVTERLNDVFGIGSWQLRTQLETNAWKGMIVVKVTLEIPEYWIYYESFGWNDNGWDTSKNFDLWDAYKWATTDAITKICSYIWIWIDVFKWKASQDKPKDNFKSDWRLEITEYIEQIKQENDVNALTPIYNEFNKFKWSEKQVEWFMREIKTRKETLLTKS